MLCKILIDFGGFNHWFLILKRQQEGKKKKDNHFCFSHNEVLFFYKSSLGTGYFQNLWLSLMTGNARLLLCSMVQVMRTYL